MTKREMIHGHYYEIVDGKPILRHYSYVAVGEISEAEAVRRWAERDAWLARREKERELHT